MNLPISLMPPWQEPAIQLLEAADLGDLRFRRGEARELDGYTSSCGSCARIFLLCRHHSGIGWENCEQVSAKADASDALENTVARYNSFVDAGKDADFGKPAPKFKIQTPPFHAAWATP